MKLSIKDKKLLLTFLGLLLLAVSYFFVYRPQLAEADRIEAENIPLEQRLEELLKMAADKEFYVQETESMQAEIQEYCRNFPSAVRPEDGIVLAKNMETAMDMQIADIGLGEPEFLSSLDGQSEEERVENADETLMEQAAAPTEEQIREIEEAEGISHEEARKKAAEANALDAAMETLDILLFTPTLYRVQDTLSFKCTYDSLKNAVGYLAGQTGRMTLNNVNASFDPATGNLIGSMSVNMFYMTGADTYYAEPDAGSVALGTKNIFGTLEAPAAQNPEGEAPEGEAPAGENPEEAPAEQ